MGVLSMVFKGVDNLTPVTNSVRTAQNHLNKDTKETSALLKQLGQRQEQLAKDMSKAQAKLEGVANSLREAKKEFKDGKLSETHLTEAIADYNRAKDAVGNYAQAIKDTKKAIRDLGDEQRRQSNRSGSAGVVSGEGKNGLLGTLAKSGLTKMLGGSLAQVSGALVGSALGNEAGTMFSSTLSGVTSGAAMGMVAGPWGAVIGGLVGGISGIINGQTKIFEEKDDAFRAYVQETTEAQLESINDGISNGSSIASGRERDLISFATLFGSRDTAKSYLGDLVDMANTTPFLYDDLTAMSKTLATYGYGAKEILPALKTIGDAGAALGMETSDMTMVATALGRMKSSGKTTLEYLNILNDRGIGAVGMLADHYKVSQGEIYNMISKGQLEGGQTVKIITEALQKQFSGSMAEQSKTYGGLSSTMEGLEQELDNAYGEGYNEERKKGMREQIDFLGGESGASMQEANRAMGAWKASLENEAEEMERTALETVMTGITSDKLSPAANARLRKLAETYKEAMTKYDEGDESAYADMGYALAEAKVIAMGEYQETDGAKLARDAELKLANDIRIDANSNEAWKAAGYEKGLQYTKGMIGAIRALNPEGEVAPEYQSVLDNPYQVMDEAWYSAQQALYDSGQSKYRASDLKEIGLAAISGEDGSHAAGLSRVPYDGYKAVLHEGERVLTASETRQADRAASPNINITVNVDGSAAGNAKDLAVTVAQEIVKNLAQAKKLYAR